MSENNAPPTQPTVEEVVRQLDSQAKFLHQASSEIGCAGHYGWGNTCSQAADAIEDAIALLSALEKDATRYAWLRGDPLRPPNNPFEVLQWNDGGPAALHGIELDTAIDLARGQS